MGNVTAERNHRQAKAALKMLRTKYKSLALKIGWEDTPKCLKGLLWDDPDAVAEAARAIQGVISQAETELERQRRLEAAPDLVEPRPFRTPEPAPEPDHDHVHAPEAAPEDEADLGALPVPLAPETLVMPAREAAGPVTDWTDLIAGTTADLVAARERRAVRVAWGAVLATAFVLGLLLGLGVGNVALVGSLLAGTMLFGWKLVRLVRVAVARMTSVERAWRVGVLAAGGMLLFGTMGAAAASTWTWLVALFVFGLFADRLFLGGRADAVTVTVEHR